MHNSYIASTISLRTRTPRSYDCSNPYYPCSPLLSRLGSCPCCCASSICGFFTCPAYCYNLYGLRQSSLIQRSPYRKVIPYGFDRCSYTRVPVCGAERRYCCVDVSKIRERLDRVCNIREKHVFGRRAGYRKCTVFEERIESCDLEGVDEAEALLSLLADDTDDDYDDDHCFLVRKEDKRRLIKKPFLEKRETSEVCNECGNRKKKSGSDVSKSGRRRDYGSVLTSSMKENERIRKENEKDQRASLSEENRRVRSREECSNSLSKSRVAREREEIEDSSRITNVSSSKRRLARESALRIEDWETKKRSEEREDLLRKEEQRQRLRRDGSGCSSYYSLSSTGDYESENDHEIKEGVLREESSSGYKGNSRSNEVVYRKSNEENQRYEDYREENEFSLTKKSSAKEMYSGSGIVESDFRKKSEKKLADVSIEEVDSRDKTLHKDEKFSMSHESDYKKSSDYYVTNDDKKSEVTQSVNINVERIQQQRQQALDDDVSRKHENKMKYKRFLETQEARTDDVRKAYGSEKIYGGKNEMSTQVVSSSHGDVKELRSGVGVCIRDDEYQKTSHKVSDVTKIQEIDIKRTSVTDQRFQTSVKEENIISSVNNASKERERYDQLSVTSGMTQNLSKKQGTSIFGKQSNVITIQGETVNAEDTNNETASEIIVKPSSSNLKDTEQFRIESNVENFGHKVSDGTIRSDSSSLRGPKLKRSPALHELPSKFSSQEDAIESGSRLEKSSARYAGEFVEKAKNEILSSERKNSEIKLELEEHQEQKNLVQYISGGSQSKKSDSRENDRISGSKGPRDEMWRVEGPSVEESRVEGESSGGGKTLVKRSGKTLWNIISDIVLLRWSPRSETTHNTVKKINGKSSPNQSTSSETWFSGHEAEQASPDKVEQPSILGLSPESIEHKADSKVEEASSSLTKDSITSISLPSGKEIITQGDYGTTSSVALTDPTTRLPSLKLRRSPIVRAVSESGETSTSDSGISEQPNTDLTESSEQVVNEARLKKLQRKDQIMRNEFDEWEEAYRLESEQRKIDEFFMREALLEAEKAADKWEVPVGAVLVHNGKIIARGYNLVEELRDSTAHAEMACIRQASNVLRTWRLSETTLYVTLEPCPMCAGAILQARIDCVVWGAPNKLLGADGSWIRLFPSGDGGDSLDQSDKPPAPVHPFHPKIVVRRGVLASECADTMQQFFKLRRKKKDNIKPETPPSSVACLPISHHHPSKLLTKMHGAFHLMFCL